MSHLAIHPDRRCINCAQFDEGECANGFPKDIVVCTAHQTETESDFFINAPDRAPITITPQTAGVQ